MELNPEPKCEIKDIVEISTRKRKKLKVKVFKIFEREETEEEAEARELAEEQQVANKGGKAKPKVVDDEESDGPVMVKDVKYSNIDLGGKMPVFSKWIGSILQVIIDRDIKDAYVTPFPLLPSLTLLL